MTRRRIVIIPLFAILIAAFAAPILARPLTQDGCTLPDTFDGQVDALRTAVTDGDRESVAATVDTLKAQLDALTRACATLAPTEATEAVAANDGLSLGTAFALGESGPVMEGQGALTINRFVRGATSANARFLSYRRPDSGAEWLIVNATFTCTQSVCDSPEKQAFILVGDAKQLYSNLVYVNGGNFEDQLKGQTLEGGSVTGWLWFQVLKTDSNLVMAENSDSPHFFALYKVAESGASVVVSASGTINLRSCPGTDCAVIGRAAQGDRLVLIEDDGAWLHVRTLDGTEGYVLTTLVQKQ